MLFWGSTKKHIIHSVLFMSGLKSQMLQIEVKSFEFFTSFGILNCAYGTKFLLLHKAPFPAWSPASFEMIWFLPDMRKHKLAKSKFWIVLRIIWFAKEYYPVSLYSINHYSKGIFIHELFPHKKKLIEKHSTELSSLNGTSLNHICRAVWKGGAWGKGWGTQWRENLEHRPMENEECGGSSLTVVHNLNSDWYKQKFILAEI